MFCIFNYNSRKMIINTGGGGCSNLWDVQLNMRGENHMRIDNEPIGIILNETNSDESADGMDADKINSSTANKNFNFRSRIEDLREQKALERMMNDNYGDLDWH